MLNDLTTSSPSAARRTREMIGQIEARERLEAALRPSDHSFKVVLLQAEGGMGKTRLLEEILRRYGPSPVSYTHLRAHETVLDLVCRLLLEKKMQTI